MIQTVTVRCCRAELGSICDALAEELFESEFVVHGDVAQSRSCGVI